MALAQMGRREIAYVHWLQKKRTIDF